MGLYLFDLDGTLIASYMERPDRAYRPVEVLPGRRELLAQLLSAGHEIGIITNQAGVALGMVTERQFHTKVARAIEQLGLPPSTPVKVCFAHHRSRRRKYADPDACARRKPSGAMLRELMEELGYRPDQTIYVGDRPEDEAAARDAGVSFQTERQFFDAD